MFGTTLVFFQPCSRSQHQVAYIIWYRRTFSNSFYIFFLSENRWIYQVFSVKSDRTSGCLVVVVIWKYLHKYLYLAIYIRIPSAFSSENRYNPVSLTTQMYPKDVLSKRGSLNQNREHWSKVTSFREIYYPWTQTTNLALQIPLYFILSSIWVGVVDSKLLKI